MFVTSSERQCDEILPPTPAQVYNPATNAVIATVASSGAKETQKAIQAASQALPAWRAKTGKERGQILRK